MTRRLLAVLVLAAAVGFVYRAAPGAYFYEDDFQWLVTRWSFRPSDLLNIDLFSHFYRPVIELYFWIGLPLFGGSARLFHIANVVLHVVNAVVLMALARRISDSDRYAFLAALFFAVLPGYIEAVAWVSALAEPVSGLFGCLMLYFWLGYRTSGRPRARIYAAVCFALALLTHESAVVFLALAGLADLAFARAAADMRSRRGLFRLVREYLPFVVLVTAYLAVDLTINSRSYLIDEGHYRFGGHAVRNMLGYIVSLYVGKRDLVSFLMIGIVLVALAVVGSPRVRFAIGWMLLALLPFAFFTWGNTSRYLYLPAMGFALLLADGIESLDRALAPRLTSRPRAAIVALVSAAIAIRFMTFASEAVETFAQRTERYRQLGAEIRAAHGELAPGSEVVVDRATAERFGRQYVEAVVHWEYRDPTLQVTMK